MVWAIASSSPPLTSFSPRECCSASPLLHCKLWSVLSVPGFCVALVVVGSELQCSLRVIVMLTKFCKYKFFFGLQLSGGKKKTVNIWFHWGTLIFIPRNTVAPDLACLKVFKSLNKLWNVKKCIYSESWITEITIFKNERNSCWLKKNKGEERVQKRVAECCISAPNPSANKLSTSRAKQSEMQSRHKYVYF